MWNREKCLSGASSMPILSFSKAPKCLNQVLESSTCLDQVAVRIKYVLENQVFAWLRPFRKRNTNETFEGTFKLRRRWGPRNRSPRLRSSRTQRKTNQRERTRQSVASAWATKTVSRR